MGGLYELRVRIQPIPPANFAVGLWLVNAVDLVTAGHKVMTNGEIPISKYSHRSLVERQHLAVWPD